MDKHSIWKWFSLALFIVVSLAILSQGITLGLDLRGGVSFVVQIKQRVLEDTGLNVDAAVPVCVGAGGSFRFGRLFLVGFSGSWGFSEAKNFAFGQNTLSLYDLFQVGKVGTVT